MISIHLKGFQKISSTSMIDHLMIKFIKSIVINKKIKLKVNRN